MFPSIRTDKICACRVTFIVCSPFQTTYDYNAHGRAHCFLMFLPHNTICEKHYHGALAHREHCFVDNEICTGRVIFYK